MSARAELPRIEGTVGELRVTEVAHLADRDQVLHRAGDLLDGDVRIDAVNDKSARSLYVGLSRNRLIHVIKVSLNQYLMEESSKAP